MTKTKIGRQHNIGGYAITVIRGRSLPWSLRMRRGVKSLGGAHTRIETAGITNINNYNYVLGGGGKEKKQTQYVVGRRRLRQRIASEGV